MSLGPPFDDSGLGARRLAGAALLLALALAVTWVLALSDRTLGPGLTVRVRLGATGPLRAGAKVRLAGRDIGEVRGAVRVHAADGDHVELTLFLARAWAGELRRNSQLFVTTPSVLGEAYLELGPPAHGAERGPPVADGEQLAGVDPPDIDHFLARSEESLRRALALLNENRPALDELLRAGDELLATLAALPAEPGQLRRIVDQAALAFAAGADLAHTLGDAHALGRSRAAARTLGAIVERAAPELRTLGAKLDRALDRVARLATRLTPEARARWLGGLAAARHAVALAGRAAAGLVALVDGVERGDGTLGGLLNDRELYDDLHETHRLLKSQPWSFILKPIGPDKRRPAAPPLRAPR